MPLVAFALVAGVGFAVWRSAAPQVAVAPSPPRPSLGRAEGEPAPAAEPSLPVVEEPTWLRANNLRHTEYDVEASESARRERDRIGPRRSVPKADIDGEVLTGFGEQSWSAAIARATQRRLEKRPR